MDMGYSSMDIRLRAMEPEDLDTLYKIENDMALWDVGMTNVPYSRYALHNYMSGVSNDIYADRQVRLIIERKDGVVVGMVDLVNFDPRHKRAEIGIVIEKRYRRQGYASMALSCMAEYSKSILHLHQLYVIVDASNVASVSLFKKMGYTATSYLKEWLYDGSNYHDAVLMQVFF